MSRFPQPLERLITILRKLPGVGAKTAERYAFEMLSWPQDSLSLLSEGLRTLRSQIAPCPDCGCLQAEEACKYCNPAKRDTTTLCIVSSPKDIYPIEETQIFKGLYHVLGGVLNPMQGYNTETFDIEKIKRRIEVFEVKDVVLALDATLEGDATSLYLKEEIQSPTVKVSRLAFGIPIGSSLDYVDPGTLTRAFLGRQEV